MNLNFHWWKDKSKQINGCSDFLPFVSFFGHFYKDFFPLYFVNFKQNKICLIDLTNTGKPNSPILTYLWKYSNLYYLLFGEYKINIHHVQKTAEIFITIVVHEHLATLETLQMCHPQILKEFPTHFWELNWCNTFVALTDLGYFIPTSNLL